MSIQLSPDAHFRDASFSRQFYFSMSALDLFFVMVRHSSNHRARQDQEQRSREASGRLAGYECN